MTKKYKLAIFAAFLLCSLGVGNTSIAGFIEVEKNVFLHAAPDGKGGKKLFLVYGLDDGYHDAKADLQKAIDKGEVVDLGKNFYDPEHKKDFAHSLKEGWKDTGSLFTKIFSEPMDSIQKIGPAFHADLYAANDAFYSDSHKPTAVVKYSALATWAVVHGSYYLLVEAPAEALVYSVGTAGAIPGHLAWRGLTIGFGSTLIGAKFGYHVLSSLSRGVYSIASTTTAGTLTALSSGGVFVWNGIKWVFSGAHHGGALTAELSGSIDIDFHRQAEIANRIVEYLEKHGYRIKKNVKDFNSEISILDQKSNSKIKVEIYPENGKLAYKLIANKKYFETEEMKAFSFERAKQVLTERVEAAKAEIQASLKAN